jgi:hypothetical protein
MSFLALITPLSSGGEPTHPIYNPPYPSQGPGFPTNPIAPGGPPLGFWGGTAPPWVSHPIAPGGPPPQIWPSPGVPTHPIYNPPYPSQGPGFPTHPIAPGGPGLGFWGGTPPNYVDIGGPGPQPRPEHPIVLPPDLPPTLPPPDSRPVEWKVLWSPSSGWVVVGRPQGPMPTPST